MLVDDILHEISALQCAAVKNSYLRFFKAGTIQKDVFLGVKIPYIRALAKKYYKKLTLAEIEIILQNEIHEIRYFALSALVLRAKNKEECDEISKIYLKNLKYINNWDLIDISAPYILNNQESETIWKLAKSENFWLRRVAILSQLAKIRSGDYELFLEFASFLINDKEDLVQKPIGWLLREVGKVSLPTLKKYLDENVQNLSRTSLRYAIEKLSTNERQKYLKIKKV